MYKVHFTGDQDPWSVVETPTGLVIDQYSTTREAKIIANQLNGGNGFRGWTPAYLLEKLQIFGE